MRKHEEAAELLAVAKRELKSLRGMLDPDVFADEVFGFLAQQAVEKALKAWLCLRGRSYPFTHDLTDLLSRLEDSGEDVGELWDLAELNAFAVQLRYSSLPAGDEPVDRAGTIERVEAVVQRVADSQ
jgi:HEPN domain-containing protein